MDETKEMVAYKLVKLYFEQIARLGYKRKLDLDAIISAYLYTLNKLEHAHMEKIKDKQPDFVVETSKELAKELEK